MPIANTQKNHEKQKTPEIGVVLIQWGRRELLLLIFILPSQKSRKTSPVDNRRCGTYRFAASSSPTNVFSFHGIFFPRATCIQSSLPLPVAMTTSPSLIKPIACASASRRSRIAETVGRGCGTCAMPPAIASTIACGSSSYGSSI